MRTEVSQTSERKGKKGEGFGDSAPKVEAGPLTSSDLEVERLQQVSPLQAAAKSKVNNQGASLRIGEKRDLRPVAR
jgi:hypothetical protein